MAEFQSLIVKIADNVQGLRYVEELVQIILEECEKPKSEYKQSRVMLLAETYISQSNHYLEEIENLIQEIRKSPL